MAWYGYYLDVYYFARRAVPHDPSFEVRADTLFNIARSTDEFRTLRELGEPGARMYRLFLAIR